MALNFFKRKEAKTDSNDIPIETTEPISDNNQVEPVIEIEKANQEYLKSPEGTPPPLITDLEEKQKEIKKKKTRFNITFYAFLLALFLIIFGGPIIKFYKQNFLHQVPVVQNPEPQKPPEEPAKVDPESIVEYSNDTLKISLERLYKTSLFEHFDQPEITKKIEIIYDKNNPGKDITVEELSEGYIFRISVFYTTLRKIDEIAQVKKESFIASCPKTATLSKTVVTQVDGVDARTFEVNNCGSDFKVTYVVKNGMNYEFSQIFKGNLGYRQAYKAETENILRSVKFYPEEKPEPGPTETYYNEKLKFSLDYPRSLSKDCCKATGPISKEAIELFTIGDENTYVDENNLDAITVYEDSNKEINFDAYIEKQKTLLVDDYIVTMGESPKPEIRTMKVGDRDAIMLRGYSWRGNDLIYLNISNNERASKILVISVKNISGESFANVTDEILKSFRFF